MLALISMIAWMLPASALKNRILNRLGYSVHPTAKIGPCLAAGLGEVTIGENAEIGPFNVLRGVGTIRLGFGSEIGSFNWISAHPAYQAEFPGAGTFMMGVNAAMTSRHYIDCSGTVELCDFALLAGHRSTVLTHELSVREPIQQVGRVTLGERSVVFTNCVVLMGAHVPPSSIVAASSTFVRKSSGGAQGLYGGSPAKRIGDVPSGEGTLVGRHMRDVTDLTVVDPLGTGVDASLGQGFDAGRG